LAVDVLAEYRELVAVLMLMSADMQADLVSFLSANAIVLSGSYTTVTCVSTGDCSPEYVEEVLDQGLVVRSAIEPYSAEGDFDDDGFSNLTEYENVIAMGGVDTDFALAASSPELDGTSNVQPHASSGGCFIATAAYGTPMAGEIDALRTVRDTWLLDNAFGASFVETYYRLSPPIADAVAKSPALRTGIRFVLTPVIAVAKLINSVPMLFVALFGFILVIGIRRSLRTHRTHA
jgi:hypothetical protein